MSVVNDLFACNELKGLLNRACSEFEVAVIKKDGVKAGLSYSKCVLAFSLSHGNVDCNVLCCYYNA